MPRYYFDFWNGQTVSSDKEGVECSDEQPACQAAAKVLLDLARDNIESASSSEFSIEISGEARKPVYRVTLQFEIERLTQSSAT
jgi:hypothetical protein